MNVYQQILTRYWGYSNFRPLQEDIIRSVSEGRDTLGLMPTGGGKSITFQVPALVKEGICIVITPLIALMKDQVENLKNKGIKALAIYTGMSKHEVDIAFDNCAYGNIKFLYISPERLSTELFQVRLQKMNVNLIAVDESHCISHWGYDFRPSYLKIAEIRNLLPGVPVLALTATATPQVVDDIQEKLHFREKNVLKKSFERKNLVYIVRDVEDKLNYLLKIVKKEQGSGIVYVRSRKKTKEIAKFLWDNGVSTDFYHAGLDNKLRDHKQNEWKSGKRRVIVATNAFGMGIDKANVRFVVHVDLPDSLEAYFQEAGRAGRDEKRAYAVLLYNKSDARKLEKRIVDNFPGVDEIKRVYHALGNYYQLGIGYGNGTVHDFNISDFAKTFNFNAVTVHSSLKFLQREGYLDYSENVFNPSKIFFTISREGLYKFQVKNSAYDAFIKLLLRSYTGVFNEYVKIDEYELAKKASIPPEAIQRYLQSLNNSRIIRYIPQKKTPLITYTSERIDQKQLFISPDNYRERKERFIERVNSVLEYASRDNKCRSQILLSYFGEKDPYRCGQCDVCMKRNELDLSKYEFDIILEKIKLKLKDERMSTEELIKGIPYEESKIAKVIQWLLDNDKIRYMEGEVLAWNS